LVAGSISNVRMSPRGDRPSSSQFVMVNILGSLAPTTVPRTTPFRPRAYGLVLRGAPISLTITTSPEQSHSLNAAALLTAILNDVQSLWIGHAFLDPHSLFACDAAQKINQRAFVVVQMMPSDIQKQRYKEGTKKAVYEVRATGSRSAQPNLQPRMAETSALRNFISAFKRRRPNDAASSRMSCRRSPPSKWLPAIHLAASGVEFSPL
jgi:hypothetical protein